MIAAADEARSLQAETEHIGRDARDLGGQDDVVSATLDKDFTIRVRSGTLGRGNEARSSGNHVCAENARRRQRASIGNAASQNDRPIKELADFRHKGRSEEHTSELQPLMRISYAVFCLQKKK